MFAARVHRLLLCATVLASGCGDETPPPPPVPEEFDDPFAEATKTDDATKPATAPTIAAATTPAIEPTIAADELTDTPVDPAAADREAPAVGEAPPPAAIADTPAKPAEPEKPAAKKIKPPVDPQPVPKDTPPIPAAPEPPAPPESPAPTPTPTPTPASKPAPAAPAEPEQSRFDGTYRYIGGEAQRQQLTAAIEATAQQLNPVIRGIARKRLAAANPIREQITFVVEGTKVTATFAPGRTVTGTLGGPAVPWTADDGSPLTTAFSLVKGRLMMEFKADDGGRRNVFTLDSAGDKLTMSVTITSPRLDNPFKYALTYRRK